MPRYNYQYETSPRKLKTEYNPPQESKIKKTTQKNKKKDIKLKKNKIKKIKYVLYIFTAFAIVFGMGYQNSRIDEQFAKLKESEKQLISVQKENEQLKVNIENNLNLSDVEKMAREQLGMQKANSKQTKYVTLPKKDYVEVASEHIIKENDKDIIHKIIDFIINMVK